MKLCENCNTLHDGKYGSGRFCSSFCARSFSSKEKRTEKNEKIRKSLTGTGHPTVILTCKYCNQNFERPWAKRKTKCCSVKCDRALRWSTNEARYEFGKKISMLRADGKFKFSFNNKKCIFIFNDSNIRCDSDLEKRGLTAVIEKYEVAEICRSGLFITYFFENKKHTFNPDFLVRLKNGRTFILECKTKISKNKTNKEIRPHYFLTNEYKKAAMLEYASKNGYLCLWFDGKDLEELQYAPLAQSV